MNIKRDDMEKAVEEGIISSEQADQLDKFFKQRSGSAPTFDLTNVLYYLGGFVAIGALTILMNMSWQRFGGLGMMVASAIYAVMGVLLTNRFRDLDYRTPAGISAAFIIATVPLFTYGLLHYIGFWPDPDSIEFGQYFTRIHWHWIYIELATLLVAWPVFAYYRYPFIVFPIALTLWFLSMDIAPLLFDEPRYFELRRYASIFFGFTTILVALRVDYQRKSPGANSPDYAFWLYIMGVSTFSCGIITGNSDSEFIKFIVFSIHLLMIFFGVVISRRVFAVFGALGVLGYLGHLSNTIFKDSWLYPISLTLIGLGVIVLGVYWQKNEKNLRLKFQSLLPSKLQRILAIESQ